MDVGLFSQLNNPTIASGTTLVATSGHSAAGRGQAEYAYDSTLTSSYVSANPRTAFSDASGRVFRLALTRRTPYMFGAVGDGTTDDTVPLQAFFDDAYPAANGKANTYDFTGTWGVSAPVYAVYDGGQPFISRRFICGRINVLSGFSGGNYVLTFGALVDSIVEGELFIWGGDQVPYASRQFKTGVRLLSCARTKFRSIRVESAKRDSVKFDDGVDSETFRAGTPYEITHGGSSNIGAGIDKLYGRYIGSCGLSAAHQYTVPFTAAGMGGGHAGDFTTSSPAVYQNSTIQRTRLTVSTSSEFETGDFVAVRMEVVQATYITIAADNGMSRLSWAAGDPVAAGLTVGDKIIPQSGVNAGYVFTITGFSGTSNRDIAVSPKPVTEAATAITGLHTEFQTHQITHIPDSAHIDVFPWIDPRFTHGTVCSRHGFVANVLGGSTANLHFGLLGGIVVGGTLNSAGGYGCTVETLLPEFAEFGIVHGRSISSVAYGLNVDHVHSEVVVTDYLQVSAAPPQSSSIKSASAWANLARVPAGASPPGVLALCQTLMPRYLTTSTGRPDDRELVHFNLKVAGEEYASSLSGNYSGITSHTGANALSNRRNSDRKTVLGNSGTIEVEFDDDLARLVGEAHRGEVFWQNSDGAAPSGSLTFFLSTGLADTGWSFAGATNPVTTTKPCRVQVIWHKPTKKVLLSRFEAA